eukprot:1394195-Amorphochlora_amoeboformis.AAC.1
MKLTSRREGLLSIVDALMVHIYMWVAALSAKLYGHRARHRQNKRLHGRPHERRRRKRRLNTLNLGHRLTHMQGMRSKTGSPN